VRILVVGGSGYLGSELVRQAVRAGDEVVATYLSRPSGGGDAQWHQLDIREPGQARAVISSVRPDVVINAAYRYDDWRSTAVGAAGIAVAAAGLGSHLVHVSSDAVFSGASPTAYDESALPDPVMPYGAAKAAAETAVAAVDPRATIVRTSLITGDGRSAPESLVHELAAGTREGVLFTDDIRCPVHVADLAAALLELAALRSAGLHHVAGPDAISRHELGCLIARRDKLDMSALPAGSRAQRGVPGPLDVRLDCRRTQALLKIRLRGAREFFAQ
jgi:dTDP-4-dehydrorhamnose reductase